MPDALSQALANLASDRRALVRYYGNLDGLPGTSRVPQRLLSDTGFFQAAQFSYAVPAPANVVRGSEPRAITQILLRPYGQQEDRARLTSPAPEDRVEQPAPAQGNPGVVAYPGGSDFLMSADLDQATVGLAKTVRALRQIVSGQRGPAYHALITRRGDVVVVAALDDTVSASPGHDDVAVEVALETALVISRTDHQQGVYSALLEIPFTDVQLTQLAVLVAKVLTAVPGIARAIVSGGSGSGVSYFWDSSDVDNASLQPLNFSSGRWRTAPYAGGRVPFDYTNTDDVAFFGRVTNQGVFDLPTEVFRSNQQPPPVATRAVAQTAIATADTAGAESVMMGAYASLASPERSGDMMNTLRSALFIQRTETAHRDADAAGAQASTVADSEDTTSTPTPAVSGAEPHTYDFTTGLWQDPPNGRSY